ncbi:major facilitator superfamily domain-containing protein [Truncatella angustata]|uniref:Major facilitator superfamily domain-containing protein n=1 Tax=Truncatella angustata TaxID=152316 RepID=A0A9P8UKE4_9PEZI|nr:major facilitator superfamily domain-containing protein [Truncatella angustata]KAH6653739.1 major facilitator superfamily domain-containing protein [Truncatella angustata]
MSSPNEKGRRGPPVSYDGKQHANVDFLAATGSRQQIPTPPIPLLPPARRYSNGDSQHFGNSNKFYQPYRPMSAHEPARPPHDWAGHGRSAGSEYHNPVVWPQFGAEDSPRAMQNESSTFPTLDGAIGRTSVPGPRAFRLSNEARPRDSIRSHQLPSDASPQRENWRHTDDSARTLLRSRRNSIGTADLHYGENRSSGNRSSHGPMSPGQDFSQADGVMSPYSSSPSRTHLDHQTHDDVVDAIHKARAFKPFRTSQATTLRSQSYDPAYDMTPPGGDSGTRYSPIRQGLEADQPAESPERKEKKTTKGSPDGPDLIFIHEFAFVFMIAAAQALMLSGVAQALIPASVIGQSFGLTRPADWAWFSASYALTSGTFVLPAGRLGDLFGHKNVFIIGFFWFALFSFLVGFAPLIQEVGGNSVIFFNVCRGLQGIGPALQVPNGQAMLGRAYSPGPRKALVMCLFGASAPFGFVAGGAMASLCAQTLTWPWAFWILAAVCFAFGTIGVLVIPPFPVGKRDKSEGLWVQLDIPGVLLGISGLVLFNFVWNQAVHVGWNTPYTYFLLIISLILIVAFVYVERRTKYPLVPISAMHFQTNYVLACTAAGWGSFSIWVFYQFQFLEILRGWSPLLAAASNAPGPFAGLIASLFVARYMMRIGPHWIMLFSMIAFFGGSVLMATAPVGQIYWLNTLFSVLLMPFGMDMSSPAGIIILSNAVSKKHQGIAASLVVTVMNYSISTALGFAATVETHVNKEGTDVLAGFRGAQYLGVGFGGLGCIIAFAFAVSTVMRQRAKVESAREEQAGNFQSR